MALSGVWAANNVGVSRDYANTPRWGNGASQIFGNVQNQGRNSNPDPSNVLLDPALVDDEYLQNDDYGYSDEDASSLIWGDTVQTGTADRPGWQDTDALSDRNATGIFPAYGPKRAGRPGGARIRSFDHGAAASFTTKVMQPSAITVPMSPPETDGVEDAMTSDVSQYTMQTSMQQRDKTRSGSQAATGRANEARSSIKSRIPGQRLKNQDSNPSRHNDMRPKEQNTIVRPFWVRTAGTGPKRWLKTNEAYRSDPMIRSAPDNPYAGPVVGDAVTTVFGYTDEDSTW